MIKKSSTFNCYWPNPLNLSQAVPIVVACTSNPYFTTTYKWRYPLGESPKYFRSYIVTRSREQIIGEFLTVLFRWRSENQKKIARTSHNSSHFSTPFCS